jgi:hypothetical protein
VPNIVIPRSNASRTVGPRSLARPRVCMVISGGQQDSAFMTRVSGEFLVAATPNFAPAPCYMKSFVLCRCYARVDGTRKVCSSLLFISEALSWQNPLNVKSMTLVYLVYRKISIYRWRSKHEHKIATVRVERNHSIAKHPANQQGNHPASFSRQIIVGPVVITSGTLDVSGAPSNIVAGVSIRSLGK